MHAKFSLSRARTRVRHFCLWSDVDGTRPDPILQKKRDGEVSVVCPSVANLDPTHRERVINHRNRVRRVLPGRVISVRFFGPASVY